MAKTTFDFAPEKESCDYRIKGESQIEVIKFTFNPKLSTMTTYIKNNAKQLRGQMTEVPVSQMAALAGSKKEVHRALELNCNLYLLPESVSKMVYLRNVLSEKIK